MDYRLASSRTTLLLAQLIPGRSHDWIGDKLRRMRVGITADESVVEAIAGQELLLTTTLLIRRMGMAVDIAAPDAVLVAAGPPFTGSTLYEALDSIADELLPDTCCRCGAVGGEVEIEFVLGASHPRGGAGRVLRAGARRGICQIVSPEDEAPIGANARIAALACAGLVAAQSVRAFLGHVAPEQQAKRTDLSGVVLDLVETLGFDPDALPALDFGRVDFISAGAISHAALYTLFRFRGAALDARVIESKELDPPDLNRYALALAYHLELAKAKILEALSAGPIGIHGIAARYDESTRAMIAPLADVVAVGVDHVQSRWFVQREDNPDFLVVGATEGFEAFVSWHTPKTACAGCYHPTPPPDQETRIVPTISFVSFLSGYFQALLLAARAAGEQLPAQTMHIRPLAYAAADVRYYPLAPNPQCPVGCQASQQAREAA